MSDYSFITYGENNRIVSIAACHQGQTKLGVDNAWIGLLNHKEIENATHIDFRSTQKFNDPIKGSKLMGKNILQVMNQETKLLCLGGDHTISYGSIMATKKSNKHTKVIWIDAHPDVNTPNSSLSGNCHGMPVSYLLGLVDHSPIILPSDLVYIGLRSIDDAEADILENLKTKGCLIFTPDDVNNRGITSILEEIGEHWVNQSPIHISLDVDSMDPEFTPSTGTPVTNGLHPNDVKEIIKWSKKNSWKNICHLDIVEINPMIGTIKDVTITMKTTIDILNYYLN